MGRGFYPRGRSRAGALALAHGGSFEAWLAGQHAEAWRQRLARMRHVSPKMRAVGSGKAPRWAPVGDGGADYVGVIRGGREVKLEAKSRARDKGVVFSDFTPEQREDLDACHDLGGLALVGIELTTLGRLPERFVAPWAEARPRPRGHVDLAALERWRLAPGGRCYLARFVDGGSAAVVGGK